MNYWYMDLGRKRILDLNTPFFMVKSNIGLHSNFPCKIVPRKSHFLWLFLHWLSSSYFIIISTQPTWNINKNRKENHYPTTSLLKNTGRIQISWKIKLQNRIRPSITIKRHIFIPRKETSFEIYLQIMTKFITNHKIIK